MFRNIVSLLAIGFVVAGTIGILKSGFSNYHGQLLSLIGVVLALVAIFLPKYSEKKKPEAEKYHITPGP